MRENFLTVSTFTLGLFVQKKNRKFAGSEGLRCDDSPRLPPTRAGFEGIFSGCVFWYSSLRSFSPDTSVLPSQQ